MAKDGVVHEYIKSCLGTNVLLNIFTMQLDGFDSRHIVVNFVKEITKIIDMHDNRSILLIKEALCIKHLKLLLNNGLKSSI